MSVAQADGRGAVRRADLLALGFSEAEASRQAGAPAGSLQAALRRIPVRFDDLPLVTEGNSKIIRRWTGELVLVRLKPTVYSYTENRAGDAPGTDAVRARFADAVYSLMSRERAGTGLQHAHVGLLETDRGPLLIQREVEACNLEVRVKRFHIGSPLHRYRSTGMHQSVLGSGPVVRWTRFEQPVVCFDWRHPMFDETGARLADEPLPDDYAALWMEDIPGAKRLARESFLWLEQAFHRAGLTLVDICFFIDRSGRRLYGEISPDCMRARIGTGTVESLESLDKDVWRQGKTETELLAKYQQMLDRFLSLQPLEG